jgi:hypothetical protein
MKMAVFVAVLVVAFASAASTDKAVGTPNEDNG